MKTSRTIQVSVGALAAMAFAISMTACGSATDADRGAAKQSTEQSTEELTPLVASALDSPIPFRGSDGSIHVAYELQVLNASPRAATITAVETLSDDGEVLHRLAGGELVERIVVVGDAAPATDDPGAITTLAAGRSLVLMMDGTYSSREQAPDRFRHRFHATLSPADPETKISRLYADTITEQTGEVTLGEGEPVKLAPPLIGADWLVANGCCQASPHRRTILPIQGRLYPFERFAIDWLRLNPGLDPASLAHPWMLPSLAGDASANDAYQAYDAPLLAVADGTVVKVLDGRSDQPPQTDADIRELGEFGGNYLILDIGDGFYAFYAHVRSGTFEVEVGDHVERGSVIGHVGNSGNSTEPHLHFHVGRQPTPFTTVNWPYEFTDFDVTGTLGAEDKTVTEPSEAGSRTDALPLQWDVVTWPPR
jgi:hypothetical protein